MQGNVGTVMDDWKFYTSVVRCDICDWKFCVKRNSEKFHLASDVIGLSNHLNSHKMQLSPPPFPLCSVFT